MCKRKVKPFLFSLAFLLVGCESNTEAFEAAKQRWDKRITNNLPVGTERKVIEQWAQSENIRQDYIAQSNLLYSVVEVVPGSGFLCPEWNVILKIELDTQGKMQGHKISGVGTCL